MQESPFAAYTPIDCALIPPYIVHQTLGFQNVRSGRRWTSWSSRVPGMKFVDCFSYFSFFVFVCVWRGRMGHVCVLGCGSSHFWCANSGRKSWSKRIRRWLMMKGRKCTSGQSKTTELQELGHQTQSSIHWSCAWPWLRQWHSKTRAHEAIICSPAPPH